ncbi:MAG: Ig-like domain-containing protein [Bacteroidetes bacterium]|nr:Ig-like domain-containing protein [Bacteroidota bacterium]
MPKSLSNLIFIVVVSFVLVNCANRGTPSGGEKDITPPVILKSIPENYSVNFNAKEIKIYFDEYIKIKDLQKQLIISPPMNPEPEITPLGSASKYITIKIFDTLQLNTTYAFNFGESIVDNNEGNPYPFYRYVFSTGDYIDSLSVKGKIVDAVNRKPDEFVSVLLYEIDSTFTDSIIYKQKPKYITNTLDSTTTFKLENLKAGNYLMIALKEENNNYTFQQKTDKIGFLKDFITVSTDTSTVYTIKLFNEDIDFKATRPKLISGNKIAFGYEGDFKNMKINLLSEKPNDYKSKITKDQKADSLLYWYKPKFETDSLLFIVSNTSYADTLTVKLRALEKDSLIIKSIHNRTLSFNKNFEIEANIPLTSIDEVKITILDKDSLKVDFTTSFDEFNNRYTFFFAKKEQERFSIQMLPETFIDFFGNKNDTLNYSLNTKLYSDYGNVRLILQNATYPLIVQLINKNGEVKEEQYTAKPEVLDFININPSEYSVRVIFDENENEKYDSGNYLLKRQPERVSHFEIDPVRAGWDIIETSVFKDTSINSFLSKNKNKD